MIDYDRTSWWVNCFAWRGTVLPHILARVGLLTGWCLALYLVDELALQPLGRRMPALNPLGHTLLGVALGMFIVFRTNSSHGRFWEARSHWGMIVNASRNLVRMGGAYAPPADDLARLVAAWVLLVKEQLRDNDDLTPIRHLVPGRVMARLGKVKNRASVLAGFISEWIAQRVAEGRLDPILAMMGLFALLDLLVITAVTMAIWRRMVGHEPNVSNVLGAVGLSIGLAFGVVIFFFAVCFALVVAR